MENKIDHIGWITDCIEETAEAFSVVGYSMSSEIVNDDTQRCRICFISKPNEVRIELVCPYDDNQTMQKILKKRGVGPYHTCYIVDDIESAYEIYLSNDFVPLFQPVPAPAFNGKKICYFYKPEIGYLEIVEKYY